MALVIRTVHDILEACGCTKYEENFAGLHLEKVKRYSLQDLWEILPGDDGQVASSKIMRVLEQLNSDDLESCFGNDHESILNAVPHHSISAPSASEQQHPELNDSSSSNENTDTSSASQDSTSSFFEDNDVREEEDDEEEEVTLPSTSHSSQNIKKPVVEISLSDSEDEENLPNEASQQEQSQEEVHPSNSHYSFRQRQPKQEPDYYESESDSDFENDHTEPKAKRSKFFQESESKRIVTFTAQNFHALLKHFKAKVRRDPDFVDSFINVQVNGRNGTNVNGEHECSVDDFEDSEWKQWQELFKICGPQIISLELLTWTWKPVKAKCPYNLFKILGLYCPNLSELSLSNSVACTVDGVKFSDSFKLHNLKTLKITHEQELNYRNELECIIKAAVNLNEFKYTFLSFDDVNFVLNIFKNLEKSQLKNLKVLSIRSFTKYGYFKLEQISVLSQLEAEELQELELGNGLWEDVDGKALEQLFCRFPKLKSILIYGSFQGNSVQKPDILIQIPPLTELEYLNVGGNYEFASIFEDESHDYNETTNSGRVITVDDEVKTDLFSVSIALSLLPNLKKIILGNLFKIDNLHFASLPKLCSFRVGSPYHLSVKFPSQDSRRNCYPLIKELQLPDCLKDASFVKEIPNRFPNLERCWIFLPTVEVLRSFFKAMENASLEELYLKTQFDFECLMELCLLGHPTQAIRSYSDYMKLEDLENYEKFDEFVKFHNIELPPKKRDDLESDEYAGLKALKNLKILRMEHIPRRLRIPKGKYHFTHYKCEFTTQYIGFRSYPLSQKCLAQLPIKNLISCTWPNFQVSMGDVRSFADSGFSFCDSGDSDDENGGASSSSSQNAKGTKLKVQIQHSMLQSDHKFQQKKEKN